jgi:hypothetical protein
MSDPRIEKDTVQISKDYLNQLYYKQQEYDEIIKRFGRSAALTTCTLVACDLDAQTITLRFKLDSDLRAAIKGTS